MKRTVLLAVVALALLAGCEDPHARLSDPTVAAPRTSTAPSGTPTRTTGSSSTSATVSPSPTPYPIPIAVPLNAWSTSTPIGVAYVDAIVTAITAGDAKTLEGYVTGSLQPCGAPPAGVIECASGTSSGTRIRTFSVGGGCEAMALRLEPVITDRVLSIATANVAAGLTARPMFLSEIDEYPAGSPYRPGWHYRLVFGDSLRATRGQIVTLDDAGIVEVFEWRSPSCGQPPPGYVPPPAPYNVILAPPR